ISARRWCGPFGRSRRAGAETRGDVGKKYRPRRCRSRCWPISSLARRLPVPGCH
ncbi:hypothetical protein BD779DRAFT_1518889, partial [Infundibulicybe gibba]